MSIPNHCVRGWRRIAFGFILSTLTVATTLQSSTATAAPPSPSKPEARTPWTTGRVTGSPETPPPFELQRLFPALTFKRPLDIEFLPGTDRVVIAEQGGMMYSFPNRADVAQADPFVDLHKVVTDWKTAPNCRGLTLFGFTFHPQFAQNHYVYLSYALEYRPTRDDAGGERVSRFTVVGDVPHIEPASEKLIIEWEAGGHNGGCLKFGPDGCLYISTGDRSGPNPPDVHENGQNIAKICSAILRVDVDHPDKDKPYSIPRDNPFVKTPGARGEVWCYGLRNPWRMNFDRATARLWIADVGWELWEMIYCAVPGGNYGWSIMEGPNPVHPLGRRGPTPIIPPTQALSHAESMSITGGYVYRGKKFPSLVGHYIFGDWDTRRVWSARLIGEDKLEPHKTIAQTDQRIVAFGQDIDGELYVVDYEGGGIFALAPNAAAAAGGASQFPRTLTDTGLFDDVARQAPAPGVIPYSVNVPQWVDGGTAQRFVAVPGQGVIGWKTDDAFGRLTREFPKDSVLVRTFSLQFKPGEPRRNLETQLMHFDGRQWHGYTYRWHDDGRDADLVNDGGAQQQLTVDDPAVVGGKRQQTWHYASRTQCLICHNIHSGYVVGFHDPQLDLARQHSGGRTDNQLAELRRTGLLLPPYERRPNAPPPPEPYKLVDPQDAAATLDDRARSYLHGNCAHCHREHGGGSALIDLRKERTPKALRAIGETPILGSFGIDPAAIIAPGDPASSVLLYRMAKNGSGRMPHIGSDVVDDRGVALIGRWIAAMEPGVKPSQASVRDALSEAPGTLALDKLLESPRGALSLVNALGNSEVPAPQRDRVIARALAGRSPAARDLFDRFSGRDMSPAPKLGPNFDRAKLLAATGDATRGREVFQNVAQCAACHLAGDEVKGRELGPDLTHIAARLDRPQLLEAIAEPSKTIAEGFVTYDVLTADGDSVTGFLVRRNDAEVVIKDATLQIVRVPAADVKSLKPRSLSAMPEGLLANLEPQQAADLLAFLSSRK